ncbi:hypothetical protein [Dethiothermospora halolimnae]|uniref:hypothetical protein n=1 Tax=Dethiothermospora halolimnae TaxID=3114390 RepID=UPI003CCB7408
MFSKDLDLDYRTIMRNNIPLLVKDNTWKELFSDINDRQINKLKSELEDLLEDQKGIERKLKKLKKEKKRTMAKIINLSDEINNNNMNDEKAMELLSRYQEDIYDINNRLEDITFRYEMIPKQIREANFNLLKETIKYGYKELKLWDKELNNVNNEIDEFRIKLRELIDKKNDYEEKRNLTYNFLHGILGNKEIEKLDREML